MSTTIRALQQRKAGLIQSMRDISNLANTEGRALSADESARFDALEQQVADLNASIERENRLLREEAGLNAVGAAATAAAAGINAAGQSVAVVPAAGSIRVSDNVSADPQRGFSSFGDFARSVMGASFAARNGTAMDQRLTPLAGAPGLFAGEGSGSDGGILIPPGFSSNIFTLSQAEDALLPLTDEMQIEGNNMLVPKDETTPWGSNGVRAYWQGEATPASVTKPVIGGISLRLKKLMALVPVSDELNADATALAGYLPGKVADSIRWKSNEAILLGSGGTMPLGALAGDAAVTVAKESGQSAATLVAANLAKMIARLPTGSYSRAVWLINNDVLPALFTLNSNGQMLYLPYGGGQGSLQGSPYGSLLGRPVIISQHANTLGGAGDVMLVDLEYYQTITKAEGVVTATSMHLYFDAGAMAFRTTFRMDGQPKLSAPIDPAKGSTKLSPFVQLGARA